MDRPSTNILAFEVAGHRHAVPAERVREVLRAVAITALPDAPPVVEGVINVRGTIVPVLDVRRRFGHPPRPLSPSDHLILAEAGERTFALRVDQVLDLFRVEAVDFEEPPRGLPGSESLLGFAKLPDGIVPVDALESPLGTVDERRLASLLGRATGAA